MAACTPAPNNLRLPKAKPSMSDDMKTPKRISTKQLAFQCQFMEITHQRADFEGFSKDYFVINFRRRGGVVAVRDGNVLLVRQYRFLLNSGSWELPGGTIEDNEPLEDGLVRECVEETGVRPRNLRQLIVYYPGLDNVDNRTTLFYSDEVEVVAPFHKNPSEISDIAWIPFERSLKMIFQQEILDAMTIVGLLAYSQIMRDVAVKR